MPDLTAELSLRFGVTPPPPTFELEVDAADDTIGNRPIQVEPYAVDSFHWLPVEYRTFEGIQNREILQVVENGVQHVRLYASSSIPATLHATELPVAIKASPGREWKYTLSIGETGRADNFGFGSGVGGSFSNANLQQIPPVIFGQRAARAAPPSIEEAGTFEALVVETLRFADSRIANLRYNYVTSGFEVLYVSKFRTRDGRTIDPPVFVPELNGMFVLKEAARGSAIIRYRAPYRRYRVNYGMPSGLELPEAQLAWLRGDITKFQMPPVMVFAVPHDPEVGLIAETEFERKVFPPGAYLRQWGPQPTKQQVEDPNQGGQQLTEQSSTKAQREVVDQNNPQNKVTVEDKTTIIATDAAGRRWVLKLT